MNVEHTSSVSESVRRVRRDWLESPARFAYEVFGLEPWEAVDPATDGDNSQAGILRAVPHFDVIAARSGHKVGKSTSGAIIALWNYVLHREVKVVLTAPTNRQVNEAIWFETIRLWNLAHQRGWVFGGDPHISAAGGIRSGSRMIFGFAALRADSFSGISSPRVVYIVDEGAGVEDKMNEAIDGNSAAERAIKITFGNPTRTAGWFYKLFSTQAGTGAKLFHINSERTPTALGVKSIPGMASARWIERMRRLYAPHETHPVYFARVTGEFPLQAAASVHSVADVDRALTRWTSSVPTDVLSLPLVLGVDVARFGDDRSVIFPRRGCYVYMPHVVAGLDTEQLTDLVNRVALDLRTNRERTIDVTPIDAQVDEIGIGAAVVDKLRRMKGRVRPVGLNSSSSPKDPIYLNLRAEMWFDGAAFVRDGAMLPPSEHLRSDLLEPRFFFSPIGKLQVESKDDIKERLSRSTDEGDGFGMAAYQPRVVRPRVMPFQYR